MFWQQIGCGAKICWNKIYSRKSGDKTNPLAPIGDLSKLNQKLQLGKTCMQGVPTNKKLLGLWRQRSSFKSGKDKHPKLSLQVLEQSMQISHHILEALPFIKMVKWIMPMPIPNCYQQL